MSVNWILFVCVWLVYGTSECSRVTRCGTPLDIVVPGGVVDSHSCGHLSFRGHQLHTLYQSSVEKGSQKIIFTCTRSEMCGGLGDRFKGFVSTYILAVLLNAEFAVAWDTPSPIGNFYNSSAEVVSETDLLACRNHTSWSWMNVHTDFEKLKALRVMNFADEYKSSDCVTVHTNGAVWNHFILNNHLSTVAGSYQLPQLSKREVFQLVMDIFFRQPMPGVVASLQQITASMHGKFRIGVQMRFGGVWGDAERYEGSSVETLVGCFAEQTLSMCDQLGSRSDCSVFITTDSPKGMALLKEDLELHGLHAVSSMGESVHINGRVSNPSMSDQFKTFADWETLRSMDKLVCSRSGFGETASWAGNVAATVLKSDSCCFTDEGVEVPEGTDPHYPEHSLTC